MGNTNTSFQMSNYSRRNVRVFVREKALEMDAFITAQPEGGAAAGKSSSGPPAGKKFLFKEDPDCVRLMASQTRDISWKAEHFLSVFLEDEDDEDVCARKIIHNMPLSAPLTVLLYDV